MGIMNTIFGNVSEMDIASLQKEFGALLCEGERIERAYKLIRDKWVFTNKRLIIQDVQGVTGKKREYLSVPYRSIERFSIETAGTFDMDAEMKIWIRGCEEPLEQNFGKDSNIIEIQRVLAQYVLVSILFSATTILSAVFQPIK
jgi:hypothetical protein